MLLSLPVGLAEKVGTKARRAAHHLVARTTSPADAVCREVAVGRTARAYPHAAAYRSLALRPLAGRRRSARSASSIAHGSSQPRYGPLGAATACRQHRGPASGYSISGKRGCAARIERSTMPGSRLSLAGITWRCAGICEGIEAPAQAGAA